MTATDFIKLRLHYDSEAFSTGARAELRRVAEPNDVTLAPALYRLFPGQRPDDRHLRLAYLLPCCKHSARAKPLGVQLAQAKVSEARVLQVARSHSPLDMMQLRRLLLHIEPTVNWATFGQMIWEWDVGSKRQLVEEYYIARFTPAKGATK